MGNHSTASRRAGRAGRPAPIAYCLLLLALLLAWSGTAAPLASLLVTAPAGPAAAALAAALNPDGTLRAGASGSFDARGYQLLTAPDGRPVFRPARTSGVGDNRWQQGFGLPGTNGQVYAMLCTGTDLYIGGSFTIAGTATASRVARWNGTAWSALGTGLDNTVYALALDAGGTLYAGGQFATAGGVAASRIARWNGTAWSALGAGAANTVRALALAGSGTLYAGGDFTTVGGVAANYLAQWDGAAWSALGTGLNNTVRALALSGSGTLYAGGDFTTADGAAAPYVAQWNGTAWSALGAGMNNPVNALALAGSGTLYAGGRFTTADGAAASRVAQWNGTAWSALGTGVNNPVNALAVSSSGTLYVGGSAFLSTAGGVPARRVAQWDGTAWSALGAGVSNATYALALAGSGTLYAGGAFGTAGGVAAPYVAQWSGTAWSALGTGLNAQVNALAVSSSGILYVAGFFITAGGVAANFVAQWNGTAWSALGTGMDNAVNALAVSSSGTLYAGGAFGTAGGVVAPYVAQWNGTAWSALGAGVGNTVYALAVSSSGTLYAGGNFTTADGVTAQYVAQWNGTAWSALGTGMGSYVYALSVSSSGTLYAGGAFHTAGGVAVEYVAQWNGSAWSALGTGMDSYVYALAVSSSGTLYAGGIFTTAGGVAANKVAQWNGTAWSALGTGMGSQVAALAVSSSGIVYAAGYFTTADGVAANYVAQWSGTAWSPLGTGLDNPVNALAVDGSGNLNVGGGFTAVGDGSQVSAYLARYLAPPTLSAVSPVSGPVGTSVTLTGINFTGATGVSFNGTAAPGLVVSSPTSITVTVPGGATTGNITVTTPGGTTNGVAFTVTTGPPGSLTISTGTLASPTAVPAGTYTTVTVTGTGVGQLTGSTVVNTAMTVQAGGTLLTNCQPLTGAGSFTLAAGATLGICDAAGILTTGSTGAVQTSGPRSFATDATYLYNGTLAQTTGNGLPAQVRNLTVRNAAGLTLAQAVAIAQVARLQSGHLTTAGNAFTLLSTRNGGTALLDNTGGLVVGTSGVMQRAVDINTSDNIGYHHYSSPLSAVPFAAMSSVNFTPVLNPAYNTAPLAGQVRPFPTLFAYDQSRLVSSPAALPAIATDLPAFDKGYVVPAAATLAVGQGYTASVPNAARVDFAGGSFTSGPQTLTGLAYANTAGAGWQLLGNPYPSPLDLNSIAPSQLTDVESTVWVYHATSRYTGNFTFYQLPATLGGTGLGTGSPVLPAGQGFFIRAATPGTTDGELRLTDANRITSFGTQPAFGRQTGTGHALLRLDVAGAGLSDALFITSAAGGASAAKLPNSNGLNLAALNGAVSLAIDALPTLTSTTVVPLSLGVPTAGSYALRVPTLNGFGSTVVYLRDAVAGTEQRLSAGTAVNVTLTTVATATTRFSLVFRPAGALATAANTLAAQTSVSPNPAHGSFTLMLPAVTNAASATATLVNALGQVISTRTLALTAGGATAEYATSGLAAGVYALHLTAGKETATIRVVVE